MMFRADVKYVVMMGILTALYGCSPANLRGQNVVVVENCNVALINNVDVPAQEAGVLTKFHVREGSIVKALETLVQIDDADAKVRLKSAELEYSVAKKNAENDINVAAAKAAADVAEAEVNESKAVNEKVRGSIPDTQIRREELTKTRAELQVDVAKLEYDVAQLTSDVRLSQVAVVKLSVTRRLVKSPIDGVVERRYKEVGEWVQPGEAIMQVIRMDRLRIEGFVIATKVAPAAIVGRQVRVEVAFQEIGAGKVAAKGDKDPLLRPFEGKVQFVSNQVQAGGEYKVWAEVKNRQTPDGHWVLRPGMVATMKIILAD